MAFKEMMDHEIQGIIELETSKRKNKERAALIGKLMNIKEQYTGLYAKAL